MSPYKNSEIRKEYMLKYQREWYQKNKERLTKRRNELKKEKRDLIDNYKKSHPCEICGEDRWYVLEFHHKDPDKKEFLLRDAVRQNYKMDRIIKEMNKCKILCANCHRELHYFENNNGAVI